MSAPCACTLHLAFCTLHSALCTLPWSVFTLEAMQGCKGVKCHFLHASTACRFPPKLLNLVDLQVVQVCAEHKKPAKLLKHLTQIKVCSQYYGKVCAILHYSRAGFLHPQGVADDHLISPSADS